MKAQGFSLVELLIVVAVVMILAAISIPAYLAARARADKASATGSLRAIQSAEFEYYSSNGSYTNQLNNLPLQPDLQQGQKSGYRFEIHNCVRRQAFSGGCFIVTAIPMRQNKYLNFRRDSMCADATGNLNSTSAFSCG